MVTLAEVAAKAGVTAATVSNVLRERKKVSRDTAARVMHAIAELGYTPNLTARALAEGRASSVHLALPRGRLRSYESLIRAVEQAARDAGYILSVSTFGNVETDGLTNNPSADGLIVILEDGLSNDAMLVASRKTPSVFVIPDELSFCSAAVENNASRSGAIAANSFLKLGHRRFGILSTENDTRAHMESRLSFIETLDSNTAGATIRSAQMETTLLSDGYEGCIKMLKADGNITAVFVLGEALALSALHAMSFLQRRVPDDVSIIAQVGDVTSPFSNPSMTRVGPDLVQAGALAFSSLTNLIKDPGPKHQKIVCHTVCPRLEAGSTIAKPPNPPG